MISEEADDLEVQIADMRNHAPRPIFTQMLELRQMDKEGVAWKEVARLAGCQGCLL